MAALAISPPSLAELEASLAGTRKRAHGAAVHGLFGQGGWSGSHTAMTSTPPGRTMRSHAIQSHTPRSLVARASSPHPSRPCSVPPVPRLELEPSAPSGYTRKNERQSASSCSTSGRRAPQVTPRGVRATTPREEVRRTAPSSARGGSSRCSGGKASAARYECVSPDVEDNLECKDGQKGSAGNDADEEYDWFLKNSWPNLEANIKMIACKDRVAFAFYRAPETSLACDELKRLEEVNSRALAKKTQSSFNHSVHTYDGNASRPSKLHGSIWWGRRRDPQSEYTESHLHQANIKFRK